MQLKQKRQLKEAAWLRCFTKGLLACYWTSFFIKI